MAYLQIDETTDKPVEVTTDGDRIRLRYGSGASVSLNLGEAVDLTDRLLGLLGEIDDPTVFPLITLLAQMREDAAELHGGVLRNRKAGQ